MKLNKALAAITIAAAGAFATVPAQATPVALELALLVDISGSVNTTEYNLQKTGYVNAFNDPTVQAAIAALTGGVAVTYIEWSGASQQYVGVNWTHITDATSAGAFATAISGVARGTNNLTAPGSAINFAAPRFSGNGFEGARWVIDVSGDGAENDGADTSDARDSFLAIASGTEGLSKAINGLAIQTDVANLAVWYAANIQGGTNSFTIAVNTFQDFEDAIKRKLVQEITGIVPEPGTLALLGLGLAGLAAARRRQGTKV